MLNDWYIKHNPANTNNKINSELTQTELKQLKEVRTHEQTHASTAGSLEKGGHSFNYQRDPDGQLYVVGGEVKIDTSAIAADAKATAAKFRRATLAPTQP